MNSMILLKDKSIRICKKSNKLKSYIKENCNDCKYLLIPIDDDNHTFVLTKLKPYMKNFYKAKIQYRMNVTNYNSFEGSEEYKELEQVSIEVNCIDDLLSTLHSLNRIRYYNKVVNSNETYVFSLFEFVYFHLEVICKDNSSYSTVFNETLTGSISNRFGVHEIFDLVKPIYNPISTLPKNNKYLLINDDEWGLSKSWNSNTNEIVGIVLPYTKSLSFISGVYFDKLTSTVKSVFCSGITYNPEDTTNVMNDLAILFETHECGDIRYHDLWTHEICDIIEYVNYIQYIGMNSVFASEIFEYGEMKNNVIMETHLMISTFGMKPELIYDFGHNELTLSKFYEIVMNLDI